MFEEVRLVWNLTLKCRYHCSHCAASARTTFQDNADLKLRILRAITDSKLPVRIDFSGGDPWCGEGLVLDALCSPGSLWDCKPPSASQGARMAYLC